MSRKPDGDEQTPGRFLEEPKGSDDADSDSDDLSIADSETSVSSSGPSLITQIEGNLDLETQLLRYLDRVSRRRKQSGNSICARRTSRSGISKRSGTNSAKSMPPVSFCTGRSHLQKTMLSRTNSKMAQRTTSI